MAPYLADSSVEYLVVLSAVCLVEHKVEQTAVSRADSTAAWSVVLSAVCLVEQMVV